VVFTVITHVPHCIKKNKFYAYAPYVREMNLWLLPEDDLIIVAPLLKGKEPSVIEIAYENTNIKFIIVPQFDIKSTKSILKTLVSLPIIIISIIKVFSLSSHIHLRCPGNMGLLGSLVQILFPRLPKTAKYAGDWGMKSKQPLSYLVQRWILNNTFLTRNMQVLVYGNWPHSSKNILPFFTASYKNEDRINTPPRDFVGPIKLIFVGSLVKGKQPLVSCEVAKQLLRKGIDVRLDLFGDGPERTEIEVFISVNQLGNNIHLQGNQEGEVVKFAYQSAHFLVFISLSEGWPKAVAESMWWGCLPITTAVSCVPEMLGYGERGDLVISDPVEIVNKIEYYIHHPDEYTTKCKAAMTWSREYTLERFEKEVNKLIRS
jgi:glycosyltransferase involved in cell wall biosynthesis